MKDIWPTEAVTSVYEKIVLSFVQILLMTLILVAVLDLCYLIWRSMLTAGWWGASIDELQGGLQKGFAGALLIFIGLELLETTRAYLHDRHFRLEVIVIVAVVAVARHVILLDVAHLEGFTLIGVAALITALTFAYFAIKRLSPARPDSKETAPESISNS